MDVTVISKSIHMTDRLCLSLSKRTKEIVILNTSVTHPTLELSPCTGWCRQTVRLT
jgi:hypothetical protein